MRNAVLFALLAFPMQTACGKDSPAAEAPAEQATVAEVPDEEIFVAARFNRTARGWEKCGDDSGSLSYTPGTIEQRGDFNGDGLPDAVVTEGGTYCFGNTGGGYTLVSKQADDTWRIMDEQQGLLSFLTTTGTDGWPDISIGGPGFCFPVVRWNGSEYVPNRNEYEGKPCSM